MGGARAAGARVKLAKALERAVGRGHPWIFRDALDLEFGALPEPGTVVTVLDRNGRFLARGLAEAGPIGVRVFTTRDRPLDATLIAERIEAAFSLREALFSLGSLGSPGDTDSLRMVHGEGDRLPGVVCDRYGEYAVLRCDGTAIERWRPRVEGLLIDALRARGVVNVLRRSGRGEHKRVEAIVGELPREPITLREHGMLLHADLVRGQKTGMFLDHRPNRLRVRELVAGLVATGGAPTVANLYGYTGGFSIAAGLGGAREVVTVDVAAPALALASSAWVANGLPEGAHHVAPVDVERWLAERRDRGRRFDLVVADPPSFAPRKEVRDRALSAYRALHAGALPTVCDGGYYLAASCSSQVDRAAFEETLVKAARAVRVDLQVLERGGAGMDHPVPLGFTEGEYLVVTLCRVHR